MSRLNNKSRRRFRFVLLEERIAPSSFAHHHSNSSNGDGDPYTPVTTTVTVNNAGHQTTTTFVGGVMTGTTATNNPGGVSDPITIMFPAGTPYTYNGNGFTISYYQAPPPPVSGTGGM